MYASCPALFCRFCCLDAWIFITWILGASKDRISTNAGKMGSEPTPASKSQDSARGFGEPDFFGRKKDGLRTHACQQKARPCIAM